MQTLTISIPDWSLIESALGISVPFWRWPVVDQPLIDHWIDHARDQRFTRVRFLVRDDADALTDYLENATFLECEWEVHPEATASGTSKISDLPGFPQLDGDPASAWDSLDHQHHLEQQRFRELWPSKPTEPPSICIGRFARVHPTAKLSGPVWIGDNSQIGAEVELAPFSIVGANCVISEGVSLHSTSVAENTVLGAFTQFENHVVAGGNILNRAERIRLGEVDAAIARPLRKSALTRRLFSLIG